MTASWQRSMTSRPRSAAPSRSATDSKPAPPREQLPSLKVRIGMASGRPVDRDNDIYGQAVVLASRICDVADAGHILTSDEVRSNGADAGYSFQEAGDRPLKGFADPVSVYELLRRSV